MKAYKHIDSAKKVLEKLSNEAKTSKSIQVYPKDINTLIELLNSFEDMMVNKYHTDFFDILILSRMYQTLIKSDSEININEFIMFFDLDFRKGREFIKKDIVGFLQGIQLENSLKKGGIYQDDFEVWGKAIDSLLSQIKNKITWDKKWN